MQEARCLTAKKMGESPELHAELRSNESFVVVNINELLGFDPLSGLEDEARDDGLDVNLGSICWSFDDEALKLFISRILPFWNDLHAVADLEWIGAAARDGLFHGINRLGLANAGW